MGGEHGDKAARLTQGEADIAGGDGRGLMHGAPHSQPGPTAPGSSFETNRVHGIQPPAGLALGHQKPQRRTRGPTMKRVTAGRGAMVRGDHVRLSR